MQSRHPLRLYLTLGMLGLGLAGQAAAQSADDSGSAGMYAGGGRHHGGQRKNQGNAAQHHAAPGPVPIPDPRQRLDAGALLCPDEAALIQHQAAVEARLNGREAPEPKGCHLVAAMTAVSVLSRDGVARTEVRVPGDPGQTGWTDAAVREQGQR